MPTAATCRPTKEISKNLEKKNVHDRSSRQRKIERCVVLLEHVWDCASGKTCAEGTACLKLRQVLHHQRNCPRGRQCCICSQLRKLCAIHSLRCQNEDYNCRVPYCVKGKLPVVSVGGNKARPKTESASLEAKEKDSVEELKIMQQVQKMRSFSAEGKAEEIQQLVVRAIAQRKAQMLSEMVKAKSVNNLNCGEVQTPVAEERSKSSLDSSLDTNMAEQKYIWTAKLSVLTMKKK